MLVDLVLIIDGQYWRIRRELSAVPDTGTALRVLGDPELDATVTGSTCPLAGGATAVLLQPSWSTRRRRRRVRLAPASAAPAGTSCCDSRR